MAKSYQQHFDRLSETLGPQLACFCLCAGLNIPYHGRILKEDMDEYIAVIKEDYGYEVFEDGETDIRIFCGDEKDDLAEWKRTWGTGGDKRPYTVEDYQELDQIFDTYAARLRKAGGMDEQRDETLRDCAMLKLESRKQFTKGTKEGIDLSEKLNKMIQENLSAENLRKKDEKPVEELRIDSIVEAFENAGLMKKGKILTLPEVQKVLLERLGILGGKPSHVFPYSLDAADQMIMAIANTIRDNDGLPQLTELDDNMRFDENVSCEFSEPNQTEIENYEKLGLVPMPPKEKS